MPDCQPIHDVTNAIARSESAAIHARILTQWPHELQPAVRARLEVGLRIPAHCCATCEIAGISTGSTRCADRIELLAG